MKIKSVDIARKLNISKATVSLALNNKPGVSEKTKEKIFRCMEEMRGESGEQKKPQPAGKKMIKIIIMNNNMGVMLDYELDLWSEVLAIFDKESRRLGYTLGVTYVEANEQEVEQVIRDANEENVAGIILDATEMRPEQFEPFRRIRKPMVIYDNDLSQEYHCVAIDNVSATRQTVDYLVERGCRDIKYLANTTDIYNFQQRRAGYRAGLRKNRLELRDDSIVQIGDRIDNVYRNMKAYLEAHRLPDAFIMENYQVSLGVLHALREKGISVPKEVSLVGIDELPSYLTGDFLLTTVKIEHEERAKVVMMFLEQEMKGVISRKFKSYSNCELLPGNSVK